MNVEGIFEKHLEMMRERKKQLDVEGVKIFRVSTTERSEFKECRRRWDLSSYSRQGLEPKKPHFALSFGTAIHYALEQHYGTNRAKGIEECHLDFIKFWRLEVGKQILRLTGVEVPEKFLQPIDKIFGGVDDFYNDALTRVTSKDAKEYEEYLALGSQMLKGYVTWSTLEDNKQETGFDKVLFTEKEFAVAIPDPNTLEPFRFTDGNGQVWEMWLVGRFDMIVEKADRIFILDHKTSKDRLNRDLLILDDQMTKYQWALKQILRLHHPELVDKVAGCYYNVLRKKLPVIPEVLKSGVGLSKRKDIDTTYEIYLQAIMDQGFDPEDYSEILERLQNKNTGFFERAVVRRNQHEIDSAGVQLLQEAVDMLNAPYCYPNFTWDCRWKCDFKELCLAMEKGEDVEWMKDALFQKRAVEEKSVYLRESTIE